MAGAAPDIALFGFEVEIPNAVRQIIKNNRRNFTFRDIVRNIIRALVYEIAKAVYAFFFSPTKDSIGVAIPLIWIGMAYRTNLWSSLGRDDDFKNSLTCVF